MAVSASLVVGPVTRVQRSETDSARAIPAASSA